MIFFLSSAILNTSFIFFPTQLNDIYNIIMTIFLMIPVVLHKSVEYLLATILVLTFILKILPMFLCWRMWEINRISETRRSKAPHLSVTALEHFSGANQAGIYCNNSSTRAHGKTDSCQVQLSNNRVRRKASSEQNWPWSFMLPLSSLPIIEAYYIYTITALRSFHLVNGTLPTQSALCSLRTACFHKCLISKDCTWHIMFEKGLLSKALNELWRNICK